MFVFWFNTFFIDMHLQQQHQYPERPSRSSYKSSVNNGGSSADYRHPSTSSELTPTTPAIAITKKGHHRQRSDTPIASSGGKQQHRTHHHHNSKRAMSPSTSKRVL